MIRGIRIGCLFIVSARVPSWRGGPSRPPNDLCAKPNDFHARPTGDGDCPSRPI